MEGTRGYIASSLSESLGQSRRKDSQLLDTVPERWLCNPIILEACCKSTATFTNHESYPHNHMDMQGVRREENETIVYEVRERM